MENNTKKEEELPVIEFESPVVVDPKIPRGRPSLYSPELAHEICSRMAKGEALRRICRDENMPDHSTVIAWAMDDKDGFYNQYARAREIQAEHMFEEILEISDESDRIVKTGEEKKSSAYAQNQRLKVDTRKWYLSKVLPKKFGEKVDVTSGGEAIKGNNIIIGDFKDAASNQ